VTKLIGEKQMTPTQTKQEELPVSVKELEDIKGVLLDENKRLKAQVETLENVLEKAMNCLADIGEMVDKCPKVEH